MGASITMYVGREEMAVGYTSFLCMGWSMSGLHTARARGFLTRSPVVLFPCSSVVCITHIVKFSNSSRRVAFDHRASRRTDAPPDQT